MSDRARRATTGFVRTVTELVGEGSALVGLALAGHREGEEILALAGFDVDIALDTPELRDHGLPFGHDPAITLLSFSPDRMVGQIDRHPDSALLFAVLDARHPNSWADTMAGVNHFLSGGPPSRRAIVVVPPQALHSYKHSDFRVAAAEQHITDIVFTDRILSGPIHGAAFLRCVRLDESGARPPTRVASLQRDARSRRRLATELSSALEGNDGTGSEIQFAVLPDPAGPWDRQRLDARRADLLAQASNTPGVLPLSALVRVEHAGSSRGTEAPEPTLQARQVQTVLPGLADLDEVEVSKRSIRIQPGDVIGRTIPPLHWGVATDELVGAVAGQGVVLLRETGRMHPRALAAYLNSSTARTLMAPTGTMMPRLQMRDLRELPVPPFDGLGDGGVSHVDQIDRTIADLTRTVETLKSQRDVAFRSFDVEGVAQGLREAADQARLAHGQLQRQSQEGRAYQDTYPHPIARALRQFRQQQDPMAEHAALLRLLETTAVTLGSMAMAWAQSAGVSRIEVAQLGSIVDAWRARGAVLGQWVGVLDGVGARARQLDQTAFGLADATRRGKRGRGLISDLDALVQWRNAAAHGAAPRSPAQASVAIQQILPALDAALEGCAGLAESQWILVDRADWDRRARVFDVVGRSLTGDHPDFELMSMTSASPVAPNEMYIQDATGNLVSMHPFVTFSVCETCHHEEVYYVDSAVGSGAKLLSFTTGHVLKSVDIGGDLPWITA